MKRPDRKTTCLAAAAVVALCVTGCGGINAEVPVSPIMFLQNSPPAPGPIATPGPELAVNDLAADGQ